MESLPPEEFMNAKFMEQRIVEKWNKHLLPEHRRMTVKFNKDEKGEWTGPKDVMYFRGLDDPSTHHTTLHHFGMAMRFSRDVFLDTNTAFDYINRKLDRLAYYLYDVYLREMCTSLRDSPSMDVLEWKDDRSDQARSILDGISKMNDNEEFVQPTSLFLSPTKYRLLFENISDKGIHVVSPLTHQLYGVNIKKMTPMWPDDLILLINEDQLPITCFTTVDPDHSVTGEFEVEHIENVEEHSHEFRVGMRIAFGNTQPLQALQLKEVPFK